MIMQEGRTSSQQSLEQNYDAERQLGEQLQQFDLWEKLVDQSPHSLEFEDYPEWLTLMRQAERVMAREPQSEHSLSLLGRCWALSEEGETCAEWARQHLQESHVREMVWHLATDVEPYTRWQACAVLGDLPILDNQTMRVLEKGLTDEDAYVRRRAFLALLRHNGGIDVQPYFRQMLTDEDSYNRYVAVRQALPANADALQSLIQSAADDPAVARLIEFDAPIERD